MVELAEMFENSYFPSVRMGVVSVCGHLTGSRVIYQQCRDRTGRYARSRWLRLLYRLQPRYWIERSQYPQQQGCWWTLIGAGVFSTLGCALGLASLLGVFEPAAAEVGTVVEVAGTVGCAVVFVGTGTVVWVAALVVGWEVGAVKLGGGVMSSAREQAARNMERSRMRFVKRYFMNGPLFYELAVQ